MSDLPLFPLGTVLFPGLVMPLQVFEERYRALVRDLMARPEGTPREFGVVAIQRGWEVERLAAEVTLHDIGCTAEVRQITERDDGCLDLVAVGRRRFEVLSIEPAETPYLQARVRFLPSEPEISSQAERLVPQVLALFRSYLGLIRAEAAELREQLPDDPAVLSHLVAATATLALADRQRLLAAADTTERLRAELAILTREVTLLRQVRAVPASVSELPARPSPN